MNILLIQPKFPVTYWGGQYSIGLIGKRALMPPLGLLTVAAMCPKQWNMRLVDLNAAELTSKDLEWADLALMSGMAIQHNSMMEAIAKCKKQGVRIAVGGPHATSSPEQFDAVDHLIQDEGEITFTAFLNDLQNGIPERVYSANGEKPDVTQTPIPRFDLLKVNDYSHMCIQFSRGCPFACEFCDITTLYGKKPRTKTPEQITAELQAIYDLGYRGEIFLVDDNFIGNKKNVKLALPKVIEWMRQRSYPFLLYTEASINLADDDELLEMMCEAGFVSVFIGIESPSMESLRETSKFQNLAGDLLSKVHHIQSFGLEVMAGFIIGFDSDTDDIFDRQIEFITKARIPMAMVGPLQAMPNTQLWERLKKEGRLKADFEGDTFGFCNFETKLPALTIAKGHKKVLATLYSPAGYFGRLKALISAMRPKRESVGRLSFSIKWQYAMPIARALTYLLFVHEHRADYWAFLTWTWKNRPDKLLFAFSRSIIGNHLMRYTSDVMIPRLTLLEQELSEVQPLPTAS